MSTRLTKAEREIAEHFQQISHRYTREQLERVLRGYRQGTEREETPALRSALAQVFDEHDTLYG